MKLLPHGKGVTARVSSIFNGEEGKQTETNRDKHIALTKRDLVGCTDPNIHSGSEQVS